MVHLKTRSSRCRSRTSRQVGSLASLHRPQGSLGSGIEDVLSKRSKKNIAQPAQNDLCQQSLRKCPFSLQDIKDKLVQGDRGALSSSFQRLFGRLGDEGAICHGESSTIISVTISRVLALARPAAVHKRKSARSKEGTVQTMLANQVRCTPSAV